MLLLVIICRLLGRLLLLDLEVGLTFIFLFLFVFLCVGGGVLIWHGMILK
jgi:hypothetical protein